MAQKQLSADFEFAKSVLMYYIVTNVTKIIAEFTVKKFILLLGAVCFLGGCCCKKSNCAFEEAKQMIRQNSAECVVVKDNKIVAVERGRGVSPLLNLYDNRKELMKDAVIVDKVIGRAAAFIVIKGGASQVFGKITSEDAVSLLAKHKIPVTHDLLVHRILNQKRNGLCPLEDSVKTAEDADTALKSMRKRILELRRKK